MGSPLCSAHAQAGLQEALPSGPGAREILFRDAEAQALPDPDELMEAQKRSFLCDKRLEVNTGSESSMISSSQSENGNGR